MYIDVYRCIYTDRYTYVHRFVHVYGKTGDETVGMKVSVSRGDMMCMRLTPARLDDWEPHSMTNDTWNCDGAPAGFYPAVNLCGCIRWFCTHSLCDSAYEQSRHDIKQQARYAHLIF